jgi:transglutaminase-like putative cysteine protease
MKRFSKSILAALFACLMFLTLPVAVFAEETETIKAPSVTDHLPYYYTLMDEDEQSLYIIMRRAVMNREKKVLLDANEFSEDFMETAHAVMSCSDSLTFGYKGYSGMSYGYTTNGVYKPDHYEIDLEYWDWAMSKNNFAKAVSYVDKDVDKFIKTLDDDLNTRQKLVKAYDYIRLNTVYDLDYKYCHTAYGALVSGRSVCDGYAYALQYICEELKIPCVIVSGTTDDPDTGHAWNKVKIGKNWYVIDATEADESPELEDFSDKGFLFLADSEYTFSEEIDYKGVDEPKALDDENSYYEMTNKSFDDYNSALKYVMSKLSDSLPVYVELQITDRTAFNSFENGDFFDDIDDAGGFKGKGSVSCKYWTWGDSGTILIHFTK